MKTNQTVSQQTNQRLFRILLGAAILLLIPLVIQLTIGTGVDGQGFNWKTDDFVVMGIMIFGAALLVEFVMRTVKTIRNRILISGAILFLFLLIWAELAVGIFGTPFAGS